MVQVRRLLERLFRRKRKERKIRMHLRPLANERAGLLKPPEIGVTSHEIHHLPIADPYENSIEGRNRFRIPPGRKQDHAIEGGVGLWWKGIETKGSFDPGNTLLRATDI